MHVFFRLLVLHFFVWLSVFTDDALEGSELCYRHPPPPSIPPAPCSIFSPLKYLSHGTRGSYDVPSDVVHHPKNDQLPAMQITGSMAISGGEINFDCRFSKMWSVAGDPWRISGISERFLSWRLRVVT